jgi:hypothetical protein
VARVSGYGILYGDLHNHNAHLEAGMEKYATLIKESGAKAD